MNALVTGGSGFIGSALIRRLTVLGCRVAGFSRTGRPAYGKVDAEMIRGDLTDPGSIMRACSGREIVFHTAAKAGVWGPYRDYYNANVRGTENVVKACVDNGVRTLIFTSSASVVFDGTDIEGKDESLPYPERPHSHYTATKAASERCILQANSKKLRTLSLRPHLVWGQGDTHIIPGILKRAKSGKLRRIGSKNPLIDTTYIDNAVSAHIQAAHAINDNPERVSGKAYFISNGEPLPLWDFINRILKAAGIPPVHIRVSEFAAVAAANIMECIYKGLRIKAEPPLIPFVVKELRTAHWFDITSARQNLGYHMEISIEEGLKRLALWFQQQRQ
jgi:nucleoside-diphosphate-sugar epimerase